MVVSGVVVKKAYTYLILFLLSVVMSACGQGSAKVTEYGSLSVQVKWPAATVVRQSSHTSHVKRAAPPDVTTVRFIVTGPDMATLQKDFDASLGQGTIQGVPVGSNRTLTIQGVNAAGDSICEGTISNITVAGNKTSPCGVVQLETLHTTITQSPPNPSNSSSASFSFSSSNAEALFECSLDGAAFAACASPRNYTGLGAGNHDFSVRAKSKLGNSDPAPPVYSWAIQLNAPDTTITSQPAPLTNSATANFSFHSSDASATFECGMDSGVTEACVSPAAYSMLTEGSHVFTVRAKDTSGNIDATPANCVWTIDTTAPDTSIVTKPTNLTNNTSANFSFSSSDATATFECSRDSGTYAACASPVSYANLADGNHVFSVRAKDLAGNIDTTPASSSWTIDTTAPDTSMTSNPLNPTKSTSASFNFTSPDAAAAFECRLDNGIYTGCANPASYTTLAEGSHIFSVRAKDAAGNIDATPASYSWTIDTTAPDTSITSSPSNPTNNTSASFSFSSPDATAAFECGIDSGTSAACVSPVTYTTLAEGPHTFTVRAHDPAENIDITPASYTWTIDTTAPDTLITANPPDPANNTSPSFSFSSPDATATFDCSMDNGSFTACVSPKNYAALAEGNHTFNVRAKDPAGNIDSTPASYSWTIDITPPDTLITSHPVNPTSSTSGGFTFSSPDGPAGFECHVVGWGYVPCWSPVYFATLIEGSYTVEIRAIDAAGNVDPTPASYTWTVDWTPPDIAITAHPSDPTNSTIANFSFSSPDVTAIFECSLDSGAYSACVGPKSYSSLAEGTHTFSVQAKDAAGNISIAPAVYTWTVDLTPPETSFVSRPSSTTTTTSATFSFTFSDNIAATASFECRIDGGGSFAPCLNPQKYTELIYGSHAFEVRAIDPAGNVDATPASSTWTVVYSLDTARPAVAAGQLFSAALKSDGSVWTWGLNSLGQLGNGTADINTSQGASSQVREQLRALTGVVQIACGKFHVLALKSDGTVWSWGYNNHGQLGDNTTTNSPAPVQVAGLSDIVSLAAGESHSVALKSDGTVWSWGKNGFGQLGDASTVEKHAPVLVSGLSTSVIGIAAGLNHTLAIENDGTVWSWGFNDAGQLGDGTTLAKNIPVMIAGLTGVVSAAGGYQHSAALKSDGTVYTWGANDQGQLGDNTKTNSPTPVQVIGLSNGSAIAAGGNCTIALKNDGTVWAWGANDLGQLGVGYTSASGQMVPVQTIGAMSVVAIAAGVSHAIAIRSDGRVLAWGRNDYGALGIGNTEGVPSSRPKKSICPLLKSPRLAASNYSLALNNDGTVSAWGVNDRGQLGDGTNGPGGAPATVAGMSGVDLVSAGASFSIAHQSDGGLWTWGQNAAGKWEEGTNADAWTPVTAPAIAGVIAIAGGGGHSLALTNKGMVWTWGLNDAGQLGNGTLVSTSTPSLVGQISGSTVAIAAGGRHSAALASDGTVWTWGLNDHGQLGNGTIVSGSTPTLVNGLQEVVSLATGSVHSAALTSDGTVWTWGLNASGQLGNGTFTEQHVPVVVSGMTTSVIAIATGWNHTIALTSDGKVWTWGSNDHGQLGDGTLVDNKTPFLVSSLSGSIVAIAGGSHHTLALKSDGTVWTWGSNVSSADSLTPEPVSGLSGISYMRKARPESETGFEAEQGNAAGQSRSGCFIATAAYGSYLDPHVMVLRKFRDSYLLPYRAGRAVVTLYYQYSPPVAEVIRGNEMLRMIVRLLLTPIIFMINYPILMFVLFALTVVFFQRRRGRGERL